MSNGVLKKCNGSAWTNSIAKKCNGSVWTEGKVKHCNGSAWFDNYPLGGGNQTATFNATWSQGFRGDGVRLDDGAWKGNVLVASTTDYKGMFGFDKNAIQAFLGSDDFGNVVKARLLINCYETSSNGSPDIVIGKHSFASEPSGNWDGKTNADWGDSTNFHINNGVTGGYWIDLKPTQITMSDKKTAIGGIALRGQTATNENHGKFNGISSFTTKLEITVLK
jgi:hypothetical protein